MADTPILLRGGRVYTPDGPSEQAELLIRDGRVEACQSRIRIGPAMTVIDVPGLEVLPGFIDLQINGAGGRAILEGTSEAIESVARALPPQGTTSFLPTLISAPEADLLDAIAAIRKARIHLSAKKDSPAEASISGVHMEGPFLNPEMAGAHSVGDIRPPDPALFHRMADAWADSDGPPSGPALLTFAPEIEGSMNLLEAALQRGWLLSFGHTQATYDEAALAVERGVRLATHVFNRMGVFHHREPGVIGLALTDSRVQCGLIADGIHVHPATLQTALRLKGPGGAFLISDATPAGDSLVEFPDLHRMGGTEIRREGNRLTTEDRTLAGALLSPRRALENVVRFCGFTLEEALPWVTSTPARILGLEKRKGQIAPGMDADIVILDPDWEVRWVCVGGRVALDRV